MHEKCHSVSLLQSHLSSSLRAQSVAPFIFFLSLCPCVRSKTVPLSSHTFPFKCTICMPVLGKNTETEQEERQKEAEWECVTANHLKI